MIILLPLLLAMATAIHARCIMYLTGQHTEVPEKKLLSDVTHVELAFMRPGTFNEPQTPSSWPLFTTVEEAREKFAPGTSVMVAIGGWGDTEGFSIAAADESSRALFARNVKAMVEATGADGVDIDWEYPGGNGEDYKTTPNSVKAWEIDAYPKLLQAIRAALGPDKLISAAVPGLTRDMLAFTAKSVPLLNQQIDFFNIMTYDLMNRRDNVTKHHTGIQISLESIDAYARNGIPLQKMNVGFAFYLRWFKTDPGAGCAHDPVGCKTVLMEDPKTGADLGQAGMFAWHDDVPDDLKESYNRAMKNGMYDYSQGGHYYWDAEEDRWWTWDTPGAIARKFPEILGKRKGLGGVFAWGLGEDGPEFVHLQALTEGWRKFDSKSRPKDDL